MAQSDCRGCGRPVRYGARFCAGCGLPIVEEARFCPNCGAELTSASPFCQICGAPPLGQTHRHTPTTVAWAPAQEHMGFWIRLAAWIVDTLILWIPTIALGVILPGAGVILALMVGVAYYVFMTGLKGQTLGKMAVGIKVVDREGQVPGIGRALLREVVGKFVSGLVLYLGYIWVGWDANKRGWHDHIATTYVVRAPGR